MRVGRWVGLLAFVIVCCVTASDFLWRRVAPLLESQMVYFLLVALTLGDVRVAYTVDFGGYDVYCSDTGSGSYTFGYHSKLCNVTLAVPYQRDVPSPGENHVDFVTAPGWFQDVGFFDTAWWGLDSATIDTSGNLFVQSYYFGRASGDHTGTSTKHIRKHIMAKGDCFSDSQMVTLRFCYRGLA